jgi:hypothetical protein
MNKVVANKEISPDVEKLPVSSLTCSGALANDNAKFC